MEVFQYHLIIIKNLIYKKASDLKRELLNSELRNIEQINRVEKKTNIPIIAAGGGGNMEHYNELFSKTNIQFLKPII